MINFRTLNELRCAGNSVEGSQTEDYISAQQYTDDALSQYLYTWYGNEADMVVASVRPVASRRLQFEYPSNRNEASDVQLEQGISSQPNTFDHEDSFFNHPSTAHGQLWQNSQYPASHQRHHWLHRSKQTREWNPKQSKENKKCNVLVVNPPDDPKAHIDWSNIPREVFSYLKEAIGFEKLWELRKVCKTWKSYIETEVEVLKLDREFENMTSCLSKRFNCVRSLSIAETQMVRGVSIRSHFLFRNLKVLRLEKIGCMSETDMEVLVECIRDSVEDLALVKSDIPDLGLKNLAKMKKLRVLNLTSLELSEMTMQELTHHLRGLQHLTLCDCQGLTGFCFPLMSAYFADLESLNVSKNDHLFFEAFGSFHEHKKLRRLNISDCVITPSGFEAIAKTSTLTSLQLTLYSKSIPQFARFVNIAKSHDLKELIVNSNTETSLSEIVSAVKELSTLESLSVKDCTVDSSDIRYLCQDLDRAREFNSLIVHPGSCSERISSTSDFTFLQSNLKELQFQRWNGIKKYFLKQVALNCPDLKVLHIPHCSNVTDAGINHICNLSNLQDLDISDCSNVTHKGIGALKRAVSLKRLKMRSLNHVADTGLYGLKSNNTLEEADVSGCDSITMKGLKALVLMPNLKILEAQDFSYLHSGKIRMLQSRAANPRLKISWGDQWSLKDPLSTIL